MLNLFLIFIRNGTIKLFFEKKKQCNEFFFFVNMSFVFVREVTSENNRSKVVIRTQFFIFENFSIREL